MEKKERVIYKQSFPNVKLKYTYIREIDEIVLDEDVLDLVDYYNSQKNTCLKETLHRFLGEDYQKLYGEQNIVIDDKNVADEYEKLNKLEFYTKMNNFVNDMRKQYKLNDTASIDDVIRICGENAEKVKQYISNQKEGVKNEKVQTQQESK